MDQTTLLIIIILVVLIFGGGWYGADAGSNRLRQFHRRVTACHWTERA